MLVNIEDKLYNDILIYLKYNNISDIEKEINKFILKSFNIEKYGLTPFSKFNVVQKEVEEKKQETIVEKEVKPERKRRTKKQDETEVQEQVVKETTEPIVEVEKPKRKVRIIKN